MDVVAKYVRRYGLDSLISPDLLGALAPLNRLPGEFIIRSGEPLRSLLFLVEGRAKAYRVLENGQSILAAWVGTDDLGELADFIGASYRQLGRVVRRFREEGILEKARGRIRVLDRARLAPFARDLYIGTRCRVGPEAFPR